MVERERQQSLSYFLDKGEENKLFIRYVFTQNYSGIEEFAVVYCIIEGKNIYEVVRYDCSKREAVHTHKFFCKKPEKRSLEREASFDTMQYFIELIEKNWREYRLKFMEKRQSQKHLYNI